MRQLFSKRLGFVFYYIPCFVFLSVCIILYSMTAAAICLFVCLLFSSPDVQLGNRTESMCYIC